MEPYGNSECYVSRFLKGVPIGGLTHMSKYSMEALYSGKALFWAYLHSLLREMGYTGTGMCYFCSNE
jgi:hypothetical protein